MDTQGIHGGVLMLERPRTPHVSWSTRSGANDPVGGMRTVEIKQTSVSTCLEDETLNVRIDDKPGIDGRI